MVAPFAEGSTIDEFDAGDRDHDGDAGGGGDDGGDAGGGGGGGTKEEARVRRTLEKWLFLGDERNLAQVFVRGRPLFPFP